MIGYYLLSNVSRTPAEPGWCLILCKRNGVSQQHNIQSCDLICIYDTPQARNDSSFTSPFLQLEVSYPLHDSLLIRYYIIPLRASRRAMSNQWRFIATTWRSRSFRNASLSLKEATSLLELALWKDRTDDSKWKYHNIQKDQMSKTMKIDEFRFRNQCHLSCGANEVIAKEFPAISFACKWNMDFSHRSHQRSMIPNEGAFLQVYVLTNQYIVEVVSWELRAFTDLSTIHNDELWTIQIVMRNQNVSIHYDTCD